MKRQLLTILMMACAIVFVFSSCKKDKVNKNKPDGDVIIENAVTDVDGNTYSAVKLGNQVWMAENLKTTKYADGTSISLGSDTSTIAAYRYYPNNDANNVGSFGYLYNWQAVMHNTSSSSSNPSGVQGVCPTGWHMPSDAEWRQLTDYVSSKSQYVCGNDNNYIAKALSSNSGWEISPVTCAVGNDQSTNNATGFSAVPSGYFRGTYHDFGCHALFWSATLDDSSEAHFRCLDSDYATVGDYCASKNRGYSVRCVRD